MKNKCKNRFLLAALVVSGFSVATGLRAGSPEPATQTQAGQPGSDRDNGRAELAATTPCLSATRIIGWEVRNDMGENLGVVHEVIISLDSNRPGFAIVKYGGTLGIGGTRVAVPMADLKWSGDSASHLFTLPVPRDQFRSANPTPAGGWAALADQEWTRKVDRFFGDPANARLAQDELPGPAHHHPTREYIRDWDPTKPAPNQANPPSQPVPEVKPLNPPAQPQPETRPAGPTPAKDETVPLPLYRPADSDLLAKVDNLIHLFAGAGSGVKATVESGVVTLKGKVTTAGQKQELESRIRELSGVTGILDQELTATNE